MKQEFVELTKLHQVTCEITGTDYEETKQKGRHGKTKEARQVTMYLAMRSNIISYLSSIKIGEFFYKDHATVLHACRTIQNMIDTGAYMTCRLSFKHAVNLIKEKYIKPETFDYSLPLADHFYRFRIERNLSLRQVAKIADMNHETVRDIESGKDYKFSSLKKLCDCYNQISLKEMQKTA
jgi:DNA-binding XRE family transcriptional regulator